MPSFGLLRADEVVPERATFLWHGRIPMRAVTLLVGKPGLGKSTLLMDIVARVTTGTLAGDLRGHESACLVATAEDSLPTTLVPRLLAAEADRGLVHFIAGALTLPDDLQALAARASEVQAKLLVLDPLVAFLPQRVNVWRDQDVRRAMAPLAAMAEALDAAVLVVVHLRKDRADDVLGQIGGSVGLGAAARSVLLLGTDPDEPDSDRRVLAHAKCNVGPLMSSMGCRIEPTAVPAEGDVFDVSRIRYSGPIEVDAEDLLAAVDRSTPSAREEAVDFIRQELSTGPVAAKTMIARARELGISEKTLKLAKKALGVRSEKGHESKQAGWTWSLPEEALPTHSPPLDPLDLLDPLETEKEVKRVNGVKGGAIKDLASLEPVVFRLPGVWDDESVQAIKDAFDATEEAA